MSYFGYMQPGEFVNAFVLLPQKSKNILPGYYN